MDEMPARLIMLQGPTINQAYPLVGERLRIGRSADNDIVINDAEVSRRHAQILHQASGRYAIEDLGSTNGTFVNGNRCQGPTMLNDGDTVEFGDSIQLKFVAELVAPTHPDDDEDTADLEPIDFSAPALSEADTPPEQQAHGFAPGYAQPVEQPLWRQRRVLIGCGCLLLILVCWCGGTLLFLDWYRQGELLYCGGLRPFFEFLLNIGSREFAPVACP